MTMTKTKTMTKTCRERPQRVILETYDLWENWSERWEDMTWPTEKQWQRQWQWQWQRQRHLENALKEWSYRLMTFETFDQRDEETWPDQQNRQWQRQIQWQRQRQRQLPIHLENTLKERPQRLVTFETFDQSDEETWPDQKKDKYNEKVKYIWKTPSKSYPIHLWPLRHLIRVTRTHDLTEKDNDKDKYKNHDEDKWQLHSKKYTL